MGLFGSIKKVLGGAAKVAGAVLPGPVGLGAKALGGILGGSGSSRRPAPIPSMVRNAAGAAARQGNSFAAGGAAGLQLQIPQPVQKAAETALRGIGTFAAGAVGGPAGVGAFNQLYSAGMNAFGPSPAPVGGGQLTPTTDLMNVKYTQEARAPKGYRVHTVTPSTAPLVGMMPGEKVAVRLGTSIARQLGVKRSQKPPVSVGEWNAIKRADRAKKKTAKVAKMAGNYVRATAPRTTSRSRGKSC